MTHLPYWHREFDTLDDLGYAIWMRSTPTSRGAVIVAPPKILPGEVRPVPDGPIPTNEYIGEPEFSPRRYSVIIEKPGSSFTLYIVSMAYDETGWDTEDIAEPFNKMYGAYDGTILHNDKEVRAVVFIPSTLTADWMLEIADWQGSTQELIARFKIIPE